MRLIDLVQVGLYRWYRTRETPRVAANSSRAALTAGLMMLMFLVYAVLKDVLRWIEFDIFQLPTIPAVVGIMGTCYLVVRPMTRGADELEQMEVDQQLAKRANLGYWLVFFAVVLSFGTLVMYTRGPW